MVSIFVMMDPNLGPHGGLEFVTKCLEFSNKNYCFEFSFWSVLGTACAITFILCILGYRKKLTANFHKKQS